MSTTLGQTLEEWAEQRGIERGVQRGVQQGIQRGELAASRRLLCRLLEKQFGSLDEGLRRRIDEAQDLERLEQAIVDCPSLQSLEELQL